MMTALVSSVRCNPPVTMRFEGLGLSVRQFFDLVSDEDVRKFIDPGLLRVLDAVLGGGVAGDELRRLAVALVAFSEVLADAAKRRLVLQLLPVEKREELAVRANRDVRPTAAETWTDGEVKELRGFFGIADESVAIRPDHPTSVAPTYGLFEHQRVAVNTIKPLLQEGERRAVLHLPTGAGKTRTAMYVVAEWLRNNDPSVVVWLASGRELLEQAVASFVEAWRYLGSRSVQIGQVWGAQEVALGDFVDGFLVVGLAKGWALMSRDPDWAARLSKHVRLVVFDEAHQSVAPTYSRLTNELTLDYRCALLGLTATPGRSWRDLDKDGALADFYARNKVTLDVPGTNPVSYLIESGFLARPTFRTLLAEPGVRLDNKELVRIGEGLDIPVDILESLSMSEQYVAAVLQAVEELFQAGHRRVLVFAATVDHARVTAALLLARGTRSVAVTASTAIRARNDAIRRFRADDEGPMVLVNFGVLTTGFDAPQASAAVIARPTRSLVLYSQMIGRVVRGPKAGGTPSCEILTVVDPGLPGFGDLTKAFLNWEQLWEVGSDPR